MAVKTFVVFASLVGGFLAYVLLRLSYLLFFLFVFVVFFG